jgi:diamine N-acetyltransferase
MTDAPQTPGLNATVTLRQITQEDAVAIIDLKVADNQTHFVANNAVSIAQAYYEPKAWFRAVYADETPVGFIMLSDDPEKPEYFLWRFMMDANHQGKGYGKQAIQRLVDYVRTRPGAKELMVSYVPGEGSPEGFYIKQGFVPTGEKDEDELIARMPLTDEPSPQPAEKKPDEAEPASEEAPAAPPAPGPDATVTLREVTSDNLRPVLRLKVADNQTQFVANNAISIAQAYFEPKAWFRAVYADETPVGFVMLYDDLDEPRYYLWRFMIGADHQGKGFGRQAIQQLVEYVKRRPGATVLEVAFVPGEGSPEGFYRKLGFQPTGEERHGELVALLSLDGGATTPVK